MNRRSAILLAVLLTLLLGACGSVPPAPSDRFYRLQPVSVASAARAWPGAIAVLPLRADSLYAERPIVYSDAASQRQLRQYHYHLWLYPPAQMVHDHLQLSLGRVLDLSGGSGATTTLDGRLLSFERVLSGSGSKAVVVLELRFQAAAKPMISKTYQAEQAAADDSLGAFVVAMEQALGSIYSEFLADLRQSAR